MWKASNIQSDLIEGGTAEVSNVVPPSLNSAIVLFRLRSWQGASPDVIQGAGPCIKSVIVFNVGLVTRESQ